MGTEGGGEGERVLQGGFPLSNGTKCDDRQYSGSGAARDLRGRARLGDLRAGGVWPQAMGYALGGRATARYARCGVPRYRVPALRERLSLLERRYPFRGQPVRGGPGLSCRTAKRQIQWAGSA